MLAHLTIAPGGKLTLPPQLLAALGLPEGGRVVAHLDNGKLVLEAAPHAPAPKVHHFKLKNRDEGA